MLHLLGAYAISGVGSVLAIGLAFTVMFLPLPDLQLLVLTPLVQQTAKLGILESLAWVGYMHLEGRTFAHFFSYRCAANMVMHVVSSGVLAIGLAAGYRAGHKHGLLEYRKLLPFYAAAVLLHVALNGTLRYLSILQIVDVRIF
ncbi:MAG: hypothetical protein NT031_04450 [Planctomycetota bacterium]|nr:hypothetical protein [Planctomycetota bacterium]